MEAPLPSERSFAELLLDPVCALEPDGETLKWSNAAFLRTFQCRRAKRLSEALGPELAAAVAPLVASPVRGWTEISSKDRAGDPVVFAAQCQRHPEHLLLLLRDNSSEARLHESYRQTLAKERARQRQLEHEVARRIREHEDDLAQFSEIAQLGADVVIGFLDEARAQVARASMILAAFGPGTAISPEDTTALLRALHTLKGNARSMGLNLLGGRTHHAEELLLPLRQNPLHDEERVQAATAVLRELERLIDRAQDLHGRLGTAQGGEVVARTRALLRLCDGVAHALLELSPTKHGAVLESLRKALDDAEATVTVPMQHLVTRAGRAVATAAKELKKVVDVKTTLRGNVELRRHAAQVVEGALGHLVRNAVAHAIEDAELRQAAGKTRVGLVTLWGELLLDSYHLGVDDDGRGIDPANVLRAAVARGLVPPDQVSLSMERAIELLKTPGFTTATQVTTVSGRGVGLDAVDAALRPIGGELIVRSTPGVGTSMTIRLPTSAVVVR